MSEREKKKTAWRGVLRGYIIAVQSQIQTSGKRAKKRGREEEKWLGCWFRANNGFGMPSLSARPTQDSAASHQSLALSLGQWQIRSCISRVLHGDQQKEICALEKTTRSTWQHNWRSRLCCQSIWRITGYEYAVHYGERWISGPYFWILLTSVKQERWTWSFLMVVVPRYFWYSPITIGKQSYSQSDFIWITGCCADHNQYPRFNRDIYSEYSVIHRSTKYRLQSYWSIPGLWASSRERLNWVRPLYVLNDQCHYCSVLSPSCSKNASRTIRSACGSPTPVRSRPPRTGIPCSGVSRVIKMKSRDGLCTF